MRHVLFGFSSDELLCVPHVFCYLQSLLKFFVWCQRNDYRFRSKPTSAVGLIASIKGCLSLYLPLLFKQFQSRRRRLFSNVNGEPMAVSVRSLVTLLFSVFLNVAFVLWSSWSCLLLECMCLLPLCSPLVTFAGCTVVSLGSEFALLECACLPSR